MTRETRAIPLRTCISCKSRKPKDELLRFVLQGDAVALDVDQHRQGRGAYLCASMDCLSTAMKRNMFSRAFRRQVNVKTDQLQKEMKQWLMQTK